jgi:uncharacterized membrane protein YdbT with pleckstrin-like domain
MGYPTKLLADDESVVWEARPHWRALIGPIIVFLVTMGLGAYLLAKLAGSDNIGASGARWIIGFVMVVALVWWVLRPLAYWWTTVYVLTDRRVITRSGLVAKNGRDMPLSRVNDVSFTHSVLDQLLNCGTLIIESAGEKGQLTIRSVPDVEVIQREIYRLHDEDDLRRRRVAGESFNRPAAPPADPGLWTPDQGTPPTGGTGA